MSQFKIIKMSVVLLCVLSLTTPVGADTKVSMKTLDDLNHESILLDKELEILKKKVAIKKMENEFKEAANGQTSSGQKEAPVMTQTFSSVPDFRPQATNEPEPPPAPVETPKAVEKRKQSDNDFTSLEISSLPQAQSVYSFSGKKKAVLSFSDGSTIDVSEGESFRVGSYKYTVAKIQSSGVSIKKKQKGESLTLRFAAPDKKDEPTGGMTGDFMGAPSYVPPQFLDSTSNQYEE